MFAKHPKYLNALFFALLIFALLGPTFGVVITKDFNLTFFRIFLAIVLIVLFYKALKKELDVSRLYEIRLSGLFFVFWFIYGVIALSWAMSKGSGVVYLVKLGSMLLLTSLVPYFLKDERIFWKTQKVLFYTFIFIIGFSVFESLNPLMHLPTSRVFGKNSAAVTSVFHNENDLATFITLALPFVITALFMLRIKFRYKVLVYVATTMALYTLLATGSRSNNVLGLPLILLVILCIVPKALSSAQLTTRNIVKAVVLAISSVIIVTTLSSVYLSPDAREGRSKAQQKLWNTSSLFSDLIEPGNDEILPGASGKSAKVRKQLIINGLRFLNNSYYFGVGPGNIEPMMKKYGEKVDKVNMHNWWAEVLVNFGIIIAALYMVVYFWLLWMLYKILHLKRSPHTSCLLRWGAFSSFVSLIGFFVGGIASSSAIHFTPMWILMGIGLAVVALATQKGNVSQHSVL